MQEQSIYEKILISIAIVLCACIIGYNAFFTPSVKEPTIIYVDKDSQNSDVQQKTTEEDENSEEEYIPQSSQNEDLINKENLININTASSEELANGNLPGIGPEISSRIVKYRESNGNFKNIEEIKNVNGIGDKTFEKIKDHICV